MASNDGATWSIIGIVSWGKRCGIEGVGSDWGDILWLLI